MKKRKLLFVLLMAFVIGSFGQKGLRAADSAFIFPQYSQKVSLDFKDADLKDVLKAFSLQIGVNFLTSQEVNVKGITVLLSDVPVEDALSKILTAYGLVYEYDQQNNIFFVKKKPDSEDALITRVYQLRFASVSGSPLAGAMASAGAVTEGLTASSSSSTTGGAGASSSGIAKAIEGVLLKGKVVEDPRTNTIVVTDVQSNFPNIERIIARLDVPVAMVLIEIEMLDVSKSSTDTIGFNWSTGMSFSGGSRPLNLPYSASSTGDVTRGQISFTDVGAVLDFYKSQSDTKTLARPRIMTLDNQKASIRISTDEAVGETCTRDETTNSQDCTAERYKTGILMSVVPQVSLLTDEITLTVEPKVIDASKKTSGLTKTYYNPEERGVTTVLKVRNGETIILGGLLRNDDTASISKLPFLGDMPFVGNLFRHKSVQKIGRELVVFITPRILDSSSADPYAQHKIAEGVLKGEQTGSEERKGMILKEMDRIGDK